MRASDLADVPNADGVACAALPLAGLRVLLVEDNALNQRVARELLTSEGATVDVAGTGAAALSLLQQPAREPYQVVLMDVRMPGMDGYATTRAMREQLGDATPPVVALTASTSEVERSRALEAGMVALVSKPLDIAGLIDLLQGLKLPALDVERALARFEGQHDLLLIALEGFASEHVDTLQLLAEGKDEHELLRLVHTLKGHAVMVGAAQLAELTAELEDSMSHGSARTILNEALPALGLALDCAVKAAIQNTERTRARALQERTVTLKRPA